MGITFAMNFFDIPCGVGVPWAYNSPVQVTFDREHDVTCDHFYISGNIWRTQVRNRPKITFTK